MRGEPKKKIEFRLVGTSRPNKVDEGERKFDLPKPRLSRPNFPEHICESECSCLVCKNYINSL